MSSSFSTPAPPSGGFAMKDHLGSLILVEVLATKEGLQTANGPADVITGNVAVLDGSGAGDTYDDTILFGKVVYGQLKNSVGQKVLGRVAQGTAKGNQSPPWILNEASAEDIAKAEKWVADNAKPAVTSAAAPF